MIELIPLQETINFNNLAAPREMTSGLAFLIMTFLGLISYSGVRLGSAGVFVMWTIAVLVLILTFITQLAFIWFWVTIMLNVAMVAIAAIVKFVI